MWLMAVTCRDTMGETGPKRLGLSQLALTRMARIRRLLGPEMHPHPQTDRSTMTPPDGAGPATSADGHGGMHVMGSDVTRPQIVAVSVLTTLALVAGLLWSANYGNLTLGVHDVEGAVMAPGMIMTRDTPGKAMHDM